MSTTGTTYPITEFELQSSTTQLLWNIWMKPQSAVTVTVTASTDTVILTDIFEELTGQTANNLQCCATTNGNLVNIYDELTGQTANNQNCCEVTNAQLAIMVNLLRTLTANTSQSMITAFIETDFEFGDPNIYSATVNATGGTGTYFYSWDVATSTTDEMSFQIITYTSGTSSQTAILNLNAGGQGLLRCRITDTAGAITYAYFYANVIVS